MNATDKLGLTPLQILLAKLLDLAFIQNKPQDLRPSKVNEVQKVHSLVSPHVCTPGCTDFTNYTVILLGSYTVYKPPLHLEDNLQK